MPIHLRVEEGAYAPNVLCPGDPRRATYIAETFFDPGAELVNEERGMLGYTGTFNGHPISVQSTGMGSPSIAIVVEELIMLGAQRLIRVGTCGAIRPGMHMADTVIGMSATADDDNALRYANVPGFADGDLRSRRVGRAVEPGVRSQRTRRSHRHRRALLPTG